MTLAAAIAEIREERPLWDLMGGLLAYQAVHVAHHIKLFAALEKGSLTTEDICARLGIGRRAANALLGVCTACGVLRNLDERFDLPEFSRSYLLESSPLYAGAFLDMLAANDQVFSFASVKRAVETGKAQVYAGEEVFASHEAELALARAFTHGMHGHSVGAAAAWPNVFDLSGSGHLLDVGGGSGAHAIAAARRWSHLRATVVDMAPVCAVAEEYITAAGLQHRVATHAIDIWKDRLPNADVHFYADIFHDWSPDQGRVLLRKSLETLPRGGRVVIHEMLFNDTKSGPLSAAAYSLAMLLWAQGQQYSGPELTALLAEAGFIDIEVTPSMGYWSIVSGSSPS
jgi:hypothetical protein